MILAAALSPPIHTVLYEELHHYEQADTVEPCRVLQSQKSEIIARVVSRSQGPGRYDNSLAALRMGPL